MINPNVLISHSCRLIVQLRSTSSVLEEQLFSMDDSFLSKFYYMKKTYSGKVLWFEWNYLPRFSFFSPCFHNWNTFFETMTDIQIPNSVFFQKQGRPTICLLRLSVCLSVCPSVRLSVCLSVCRSVGLFLFLFLSIYLNLTLSSLYTSLTHTINV